MFNSVNLVESGASGMALIARRLKLEVRFHRFIQFHEFPLK